ncbi:MAG: S1 RNA-binding domain-containing protein [Candidatus Campbellbacteria bacterium]|nr:S1 RNA-binding domain-containing protein [Candidatus Campbellbacteria bacterium]
MTTTEETSVDTDTKETTNGVDRSDLDMSAEENQRIVDEIAQKATSEGSDLMEALIAETPTPPEVGDLVEGPVVGIEKSRVYVDLHPFGTGVIYGREFNNARDMIRNIGIGDSIAAKVLENGAEHGYIELSLREARQALIWAEVEEHIRNKTILELPISDANKGGLIIEWKGIQGFLPASQLSSDHYPRVEDGDKQKILDELKRLVGERLPVSILTASPKEGKLIFTEKKQDTQEKTEILEGYEVGEIVEGEVSGMVDFGIFVKLEEGLEGLVHISEIDWSLVEDPRELYSIGDKVRVQVIEIKDGKISLSIKALKENPWIEAEKKYSKGDTVEGVVIKYNRHGALASIEEGIAGLVHVSEFESEEELRNTLELGKSYPFTITLFDAKEQRMALSHKGPGETTETEEAQNKNIAETKEDSEDSDSE